MLKDRYGNTLSTRSTDARDAYVLGIDRFLAAEPGGADALRAAIAADEGFALAHLALARSNQTMGLAGEVAAPLARAREFAAGATARETGQIHCLGLLLEGQGAVAFQSVRAHLAEYPRDVMVAQTCMGVFGLIGFSGQPGREAEHLAFTTALAPSYGEDWWFLAQHAFAQMEAGQPGPAEATIERAMAARPSNANAAHYRSHHYYEIGETEAGYAFLDAWRHDYDKQALLHCHIAWHIALWALARGDSQTMWAEIDANIDPAGAWGPPLNVLTDLAAILYRAELAGVEVPAARWQVVSDYAMRLFPKPGIAFADAHAALAHAMAGNGEALQRIVADAKGPAADVVRDLAEGFGAIVAADWTSATCHLTAAMADHARIGGSRAQRDLIEYAMTSVLLKQGQAEEARRMLTMRRPVATTPSAVAGLSASP
ncbi:MAG: tetratricopeptide repeat protein [Pseudomonadota bacterium]